MLVYQLKKRAGVFDAGIHATIAMKRDGMLKLWWLRWRAATYQMPYKYCVPYDCEQLRYGKVCIMFPYPTHNTRWLTLMVMNVTHTGSRQFCNIAYKNDSNAHLHAFLRLFSFNVSLKCVKHRWPKLLTTHVLRGAFVKSVIEYLGRARNKFIS